MESLGNRLKRMREQRSLSITEVAKHLEISASTYREWEYGRSIIGEPYMKLASLFNVSLTELLTGQICEFEEHLKNIENSIKNIRQRL